MKVLTLLGTRPELIKLSAIIKQLDRFTDHILVHTGQNYDYELNEIFYEELGLRKPDYFLNAFGGTLAEGIGMSMVAVETILKDKKPDAVVILGDTNSALAGIIAKRMKIPLFHLEAGNRSFDDNVPEEINRRIMDHISDVNMVYTENSRRYLLAEGAAKERIFIMGSPMKEIFSEYMPFIESSPILDKLMLEPNQYFLASLHRDENTEIPKNLKTLVETLNQIASDYNMPVILSTHPRLRKKIEEQEIEFDKRVRLLKPFGFYDYNKLQMNARCVISDSGTIAEESSILRFPAITIRNAIERPEAIDVGSILMTGVDKKNILLALEVVSAPTTIPSDYDIDNCSERVLKVILAYTPYIRKYVWHAS